MMTMSPEIHLGNIGTHFRLEILDQDDLPVDVSTNTLLEIRFKKTDRTTILKTAVIVTDGTDGLIEYVSILSDLDQRGAWFLQGHIIIPDGEFFTDLVPFFVKGNIS